MEIGDLKIKADGIANVGASTSVKTPPIHCAGFRDLKPTLATDMYRISSLILD